jgi:hypothetical protein
MFSMFLGDAEVVRSFLVAISHAFISYTVYGKMTDIQR